MAGDKQNVAGDAIVASGEFARRGFRLAGIGRLERTKPFLAGNSIIEEQRRSIGRFDFRQFSFPGERQFRSWTWLGALFKVAHQLGIDRERKVGIRGGYVSKARSWTMEYFSAVELLLRGGRLRILGHGWNARRFRQGVVPYVGIGRRTGHFPGIDAVNGRFPRQFIIVVVRV